MVQTHQKDSEKNILFRNMVPILVAGCLCGFMVVIFIVSYATLIFSGPLSDFLLPGIGTLLTGALLVTCLVALTSAYPGMVAMPQDKPAAIFALMAAGVAGVMVGQTTGDQLFSTVIVTMGCTTVLTGGISVVLGVFKLGNLIRYIPYPVIGGFFAGSGWLLVDGAFGVTTGFTLHPDRLAALLDMDMLVRWGPAFGFAALLIGVIRFTGNMMLLPILLVAGFVTFYAIVFLGGYALDTAAQAGFLLGPFPEGNLLHLPDFGMLARADWSVVLSQLSSMGTLAAVSIISILLFTSGVELAVEKDLDINYELKWTGWANVAAGATGGLAGFNSVMFTVLGHRLGANSRLIGLITAGFFVLTMVLGTTMLSYFPTQLLAGILFFVGFDFLLEWLYDARHRLTKTDYGVVVLILVVIATVGFLPGIGVGILAGVVMFIVNYSRIGAAKHVLTGDMMRSNVERAESQLQILREQGKQIYILRLHGFIFFGTANRLLTQIQARSDNASAPLRFVLMDFRDVFGLDSSAVLTFSKMRQQLVSQDVMLIFASLGQDVKARFAECGFDLTPGTHFQVFDDADRGLEWCEDQVLNAYSHVEAETLNTMLERHLPEHISPDMILDYMAHVEMDAGTHLISQGDSADDLFFVEKGQVTVQLDLDDKTSLRLKTMGVGTIVGEIGMYLGEQRTASVIAVTPTSVYKLTSEALRNMERQAPEAAAAFHRFIVNTLCVRVNDTNQIVRELLQ